MSLQSHQIVDQTHPSSSLPQGVRMGRRGSLEVDDISFPVVDLVSIGSSEIDQKSVIHHHIHHIHHHQSVDDAHSTATTTNSVNPVFWQQTYASDQYSNFQNLGHQENLLELGSEPSPQLVQHPMSQTKNDFQMSAAPLMVGSEMNMAANRNAYIQPNNHQMSQSMNGLNSISAHQPLYINSNQISQAPALSMPSSANGGNVSNGITTVKPKTRAKRGQATDPHSIAERIRREKISERMKNLQQLVPNSNKTDKASMLDEIIEYVKFLQVQLKVLSMSRLGGAGKDVPFLSDYLVRDHQSQLYFHIPPQVLDWEWRKHNILSELQSWSPDILCLQEVDKFQDLLDDLSLQGYDGIWQMRTGTAIDGCAIFWRINRFRLIHEEHIEFKKHGLQDNVAQICVLESWAQRHVDLNSAGSSESHNRLQKHNRIVVCNIHVLYNPKRGEIKLGQVRILLGQAYSISRQLNAPVVLCGDFNCTPKSPLYNFLSDQMLNLSGLDRNQVSGQNSACIQEPPKHYPNFRLHSNDIKRCVGDYAEMQYRRLDNISPRRREESQEVSVSLKMEIHQEVKHNDLHTKSVSGYHREIELLKHHVKDHDEINNVAHGSESIGNHQHVGEPITENASSVIISEKYSVEVLKENADEDILLQNLEDKLSNTLLNLDSCMDSTVVQESASLSSTVTNKPNDIDSEENPINSVCQPAEKSSVKLELDLSESVQRESKINRDSLPDNPDPKFLAELHGSEENQIIDPNFQYYASFHQSDSGFQTSGTYNPYAFTPKQAELASGNANCSLLQHNLKLKSAYTEVEDCGGTRDSNGEPQVTSYNRKFMGTVDYIWFSEGIQTTKVLDTIRRDVLQKTPGFPTRKWGSDHLALACEFAFT